MRICRDNSRRLESNNLTNFPWDVNLMNLRPPRIPQKACVLQRFCCFKMSCQRLLFFLQDGPPKNPVISVGAYNSTDFGVKKKKRVTHGIFGQAKGAIPMSLHL